MRGRTCKPHPIVEVSIVALTESGNLSRNEIVPLNNLLVTVVVAIRPSSREHKTATGVATEIGAVGVEFSRVVISGEVG